MEPSESVHAFNLESRSWKVREESGKDERGGGGAKINSHRTKAHEPFQLLRVLVSKGTFKDLARPPPGIWGMGKENFKR
ncbi:hypothetical protein CEXT_128361 [Caerostris extrusa]|uniref:Uncharacterized protein n=1 Tax=Caerostris extrusa TaxID=172846 RepID=A0AAV4XRU2_CAEEX|nr:hypothetical protein CEXT_128361 [Caerostris extrusa]